MGRGKYFLFHLSRGLFSKGEIVRSRTFGIGFGFKTVHFFEIFFKLHSSFQYLIIWSFKARKKEAQSYSCGAFPDCKHPLQQRLTPIPLC